MLVLNRSGVWQLKVSISTLWSTLGSFPNKRSNLTYIQKLVIIIFKLFIWTSSPQKTNVKKEATDDTNDTTSLDDSTEKEPMSLAQRLAAKGTSVSTSVSNGTLPSLSSLTSTHRPYSTYANICSYPNRNFCTTSVPHTSKYATFENKYLSHSHYGNWKTLTDIFQERLCCSTNFQVPLLPCTNSQLLSDKRSLHSYIETRFYHCDWVYKSNYAVGSLYARQLNRPQLTSLMTTSRSLVTQTGIRVSLNGTMHHLLRCAVRCVRYAR